MSTRTQFDSLTLAVLSNRMIGITREMSNTLLRSARSSILALCKDISCAVCAADGSLLEAAEGLPVHVLSPDELCRSITELHPDVSEGDAYLHNDPYMGNTHHADHSVIVPVFWEGEHIFTTVVKGHVADCGNSLPSTYMPEATDIYEEGALNFPCVRVQRDYRDIDDVVRMCRRRIRAAEVWYGDYLAMCGAARIGERSLKALLAKYGVDVMKEFIAQWLDYSELRMVEAIREFGAGEWYGENHVDPFPGMPSEGLDLRVRITSDVQKGNITVDLRDNPDCGPHGLNLSRVCAMNSACIGVFNCIDPTVPHNSGSTRRIKVLLRENCVVGVPIHPTCCSMATSTLTDRIVAMLQTAFAESAEGKGLAEGATSFAPYWGVISGVDRRTGDRYVTQLLMGTAGGPSSSLTDGWISYNNSIAAGGVYRDSVELQEQKYPIVVRESQIRPDSEGAGRQRGAPGNTTMYGPRFDPMTVHFTLDGWRNGPRGVRGGEGAACPSAFKVDVNGDVSEHESIVGFVQLQPAELIGSRSAGGGGYGTPAEREPGLVLEDVREGFISVERAREVYRVALVGDPARPETLAIDSEETMFLRKAKG